MVGIAAVFFTGYAYRATCPEPDMARDTVEPMLVDSRMRAAEASGGTSSSAIYDAFQDIVVRRGLQGRAMDFGAGTGSLTLRMAKLEIFDELIATDLLPRPPELPPGVAWHHQDLNDSLDLPDGFLDVILSAEVIEHLENPRKVAREWRRLLRPGGTVVLSTPNNESWRSLLALIVRGHYVAFGDTSYPAHITALLRKDITRILTEAQFSAPEFWFTNYGRMPKLLVPWQRLSPKLFRGLRYSDNVLAIAEAV